MPTERESTPSKPTSEPRPGVTAEPRQAAGGPERAAPGPMPASGSSRLDRQPPNDLEAEMALLGSMMYSREAIGDVLTIIPPGDASRFYHPAHGRIYQVLVEMYDRNAVIDLVTVRNELDRLGLFEQLGGFDYFTTLAESVPSAAHAEYYARLVQDKAMLRDLIGAGQKIVQRAYEDLGDTREILDRAEADLFAVTDQRISDRATLIHDSIEEVFHILETRDPNCLSGLPSGFPDLDKLLSGFQPGEMIIVAARPSMGKTAFGLTVAEYVAADAGRAVAFFSMEMSRRAIAHRLLCSRARVDSQRLRNATLTDQERQQLVEIGGELSDMPLYVDDTPGMSVLELRAKARRLKARFNIEAVFVDYLQLMSASRRVESRQQEVSDISRGLKALARELSIPVIVMAQLNRNPEGRSDCRPRMSDLRESGAIEQDADVIILLHREEYYKKDACPENLRGVADIIVEKQRNGPTDTVQLYYNRAFTRFDQLHPDLQNGMPAPVYSLNTYAPPAQPTPAYASQAGDYSPAAPTWAGAAASTQAEPPGAEASAAPF